MNGQCALLSSLFIFLKENCSYASTVDSTVYSTVPPSYKYGRTEEHKDELRWTRLRCYHFPWTY